MEQHRTRPAQDRPRRGGSALPPQAARGGGNTAAGRGTEGAPPRTVRPRRPQAQRDAGPRRPAAAPRRPTAPLPKALGRMPNPRLTGLGVGLFCTVLMLTLGSLTALLFGSSLTVYGVLFLPVCALTALWVRRADLVTAVIIVPIAFAVGLVPVADGGSGTGDRLMSLFTALATQAGWLYGGTLVTGLLIIARRTRLVAHRAAARRAAAEQPGPGGTPTR
ncbi:DUF6542 domain-containing protein [Streptomyces sp. NPDC048002]|uniref:DUF6542 domain-containing protein n=1 Tax=unclassified Streptomyces TaxID=2593676 RepID=UPI0033DDF074